MSEGQRIAAALAVLCSVLLCIRFVFGHDVLLIVCCVLTWIAATVTGVLVCLTWRNIRDIERMSGD